MSKVPSFWHFVLLRMTMKDQEGKKKGTFHQRVSSLLFCSLSLDLRGAGQALRCPGPLVVISNFYSSLTLALGSSCTYKTNSYSRSASAQKKKEERLVERRKAKSNTTMENDNTTTAMASFYSWCPNSISTYTRDTYACR